MISTKKVVPLLTALVAAFSLAGCSRTAENEPATTPPTESAAPAESATADAAAGGDIVEVASASDNFETLVKAVQAAGLADTLKGEGPYTVFAPTDAAFEKLPAGTLESLLKPENKGQLEAILKYHVVPGKVTAADVTKLENDATVETVQGVPIRVTTTPSVKVNDAAVTQTDITASNGVIHVIDTVLIPPATS